MDFSLYYDGYETCLYYDRYVTEGTGILFLFSRWPFFSFVFPTRGGNQRAVRRNRVMHPNSLQVLLVLSPAGKYERGILLTGKLARLWRRLQIWDDVKKKKSRYFFLWCAFVGVLLYALWYGEVPAPNIKPETRGLFLVVLYAILVAIAMLLLLFSERGSCS